MHMDGDQLLLSMRVANVRSKPVLDATCKMMLAMEVDTAESLSSCDGDSECKPLCLVVRPPSFSRKIAQSVIPAGVYQSPPFQ
jgi:hypothetical protein